MGQQALVQLAGGHRDAIHPGLVAEAVAGHADRWATGRDQQGLIEIGPLLDRGVEPHDERRESVAQINPPDPDRSVRCADRVSWDWQLDGWLGPC
jgi:hypothetical protein